MNDRHPDRSARSLDPPRRGAGGRTGPRRAGARGTGTDTSTTSAATSSSAAAQPSTADDSPPPTTPTTPTRPGRLPELSGGQRRDDAGAAGRRRRGPAAGRHLAVGRSCGGRWPGRSRRVAGPGASGRRRQYLGRGPEGAAPTWPRPRPTAPRRRRARVTDRRLRVGEARRGGAGPLAVCARQLWRAHRVAPVRSPLHQPSQTATTGAGLRRAGWGGRDCARGCGDAARGVGCGPTPLAYRGLSHPRR